MTSNVEICSSMNIEEGSFLGKNHKVIKFLSEGYFACVYKCLNTETNKLEALKISKSRKDCLCTIRQEIYILKLLQRLYPDKCEIVQYYGFFSHREHICLRFELLDQSLAEYIRKKHKRGLPLPELRPIIQQLATILSHLSSIRIIHADIKPENVLIVDPRQTPLRVKLIDFGLTHQKTAADPARFVQDMWCKSPEALIGGPYSEAVDMWCLGLMATELATGIYLYPGCTEYEMLSFILDTQGQPSDKVLDTGKKTHIYFNKVGGGGRQWRFKTPEEFGPYSEPESKEEETNSEDEISTDIDIECLDDLQTLMCEDREHQQVQHLLVDLIKSMLHLDQVHRIKPQEVLQHPFFLLETSKTHTHTETVDERTEDTQESSSDPASGTENIPCRETTTVSLAAKSKDTGDVQPETKAQNRIDLLRCLIRRIWNAVLCCSSIAD